MSTPLSAANAAPHFPTRIPVWSRTVADGLALRPFLAIVCGFWCYAMISAVLYTYALDANLSRETGATLFAPWLPRLIQYLLLLPPLLVCYAWSLRIGWQPLWQRIPAQLALAVGFALLARPAMWAAIRLSGLREDHKYDAEAWLNITDWIGPELLVWLATFSDFLVRYGFGLALVTGFAVYKRFRDAELRANAVGRQLSAARLAALRMQLSPHTLFNLLHTIRGQITWDPPSAQRMVVQLADLLRRLLNAGERDFSRLADELHFAHLYLDLQRQRFADRLTVTLPARDDVPDVWVPSLILQPIVENAVTHGLAGHEGPVEVSLETRTEGDTLRVTVSNTMTGGHPSSGQGLGLRNVRERLAVQFGDAARLGAGPHAEGRWVATLVMPLLREVPRTASTPATSIQ